MTAARKLMPLLQAQPVAPQPAGGASACAGCEKLQRELRRSQRALQKSQEREAGLQAQLATLRGLLFGRKSETPPPRDEPPAAAPPGQEPAGADPAADNPPDPPAEGAEAPAARGAPERPRRKRGRQPGSPTPPRVSREELAETIERRDVPAADRRCPCCGTAYVPNGYKTSWLYEIDWNVILRKILRLRYKPACDCAAARPVIATPAPRLGSSQLGPSVWAWCLVQVYWLFRPQAAVARDLEALGLRIPASTLSQGLRRLSHLFEPLEAAIRQRQREAAVVQADETSWPVQFIHGADTGGDPPERGRQKPRHWLWVCLAADTALMRILPSRSAAAAAQLLGHLGRKAVVYLLCDRYSAYKAFVKQHPELEVVPVYCWVHMRRDWVRAGAGHAELKAWSEAWVERLGSVFHRNKQRLEVWQEGLELEAQSAEFRACQQQLEEAVEELFRRALEEGERLLEAWERLGREPGRDGAERARVNAQGKVLGSLLRHREGLERFVRDPRIPMDNNACERVLRGPVIARRTSFGAGGPDGARAAGLLFGVFETLRRAGLNPYTVLLDWLGACARHGGRPPPDIDPWLPWRLSAQRREQLRQAPTGWPGCGEQPPVAAGSATLAEAA